LRHLEWLLSSALRYAIAKKYLPQSAASQPLPRYKST